MIDGIGRGAPARAAVPISTGTGPRTPADAETAAPATGKAAPAPQFGTLVREMAASAPVDTARVAALRSAIASGSYAIDPDAIAARLLAFDGGGRR